VTRYAVYATRFDDPHVIEEIPARGLEFSLPLSDDGQCSFTATVEPGRSSWRGALGVPMSGVLVTRDDVPVWDGYLAQDRFAGGRSFQFTAYEWGFFFEEFVPAVVESWTNINDHQIFRDLINHAQLVSGQNVRVQTSASSGTSLSTRVINAWDDTTVGREFKSVADAKDGPEWFIGSAGTRDNPVRQLVLGDRLGHTTPQTTLEFVEDTPDWVPPQGVPTFALLGGLIPGGSTVTAAKYRRGGNVVAQARTQDVATAATVARAFGSGEEAAQRRASATASSLLSWGWPRLTKTKAYTDVVVQRTLQAHADADLAASAGIPTGYSLVTLDGEPDWTDVPRGSSVRVVLDTDVYGAERPVGGPDGFVTRVLDKVVRVPDDGPAQGEWVVPTVLEV
jgi:hypothetical protein